MARVEVFKPTPGGEVRYSDFLTNFDKNPITGNLARITDEDAVKQSMKSLLLTTIGERPYQPTVGSKIYSLLFDQESDDTTNLLYDLIKECIENHELRCNLLDVSVYPQGDQNGYTINIIFNIINIPEVISFDLQLKRVR